MTDQKNGTVTRSNGDGSLLKVLSFTADKTMQLADANSVLGDRIEADGMTIIPVSKLSVGFAGGGADVTDAAKKKKQNPAGAGAKVTLTPMSFIVVKDGEVRLISVSGEKKPTGTAEIIAAVTEQICSAIKSAKESKKK